jgi:hypothetical protein
MIHLSSLAFTSIPREATRNPTLIRRQRLVERLEEQKRLLSDPSFTPVSKRWKKTPEGSKALVDHYRRLRPWWVKDIEGNVILTVRSGLKALEFEKGKTGIAVGSMERLEAVLETLIAATRAGELDRLLESATGDAKPAIPRTKKAA